MSADASPATSGRGPGRPRSAGAGREILRAVIAVLAERGVAGLTMEAVAETAGVAKTTIYRRWSSKDEMLLDAVRATAASVDPPDTGSARGDLVAMLGELVRLFTQTPAGDAARALLGELPRRPELARAFRRSVLGERFAVTDAVLRRGVERGELRANVDAHFVTEMVIAPIFFRHMVSGEPLDAAFAARVVDHALAPVRMPGG